MCLFNDDVPDPSDTLIFVSTTRDRRQLTIYQNTITASDKYEKSSNTPAMILPFPIKSSKPVILIDLSDNANILNSLNDLFAKKVLKNSGDEWWDNVSAESDSDNLEIYEIGAYNISIAYSLNDLQRYDHNVFTLNPNLNEILVSNYSTDFGFLICAFNPKKAIDGHPIAYIHDLRPDGYFVPTRHYHGESGHSNKTAEFDHCIFTVNSQIGVEPRNQIAASKIINVPVLKNYLPKDMIIKREILRGEYVNEDLIYDYKGCKSKDVDISSL